MTYTCATEGCGNPINFLEVDDGTWRHTKTGSRYCEVDHLCYAHPAGGTNTTPPEELERDVKVTMEDLKKSLRSKIQSADGIDVAGFAVESLRPLIQSYTDQAVEEATAELREQLDRALVPKYAVGEKVLSPAKEVGRVSQFRIMVELQVSNSSGASYTTEYTESSLAPLETETPCRHQDIQGNPWANQTFWGANSFKHCPGCGESLTKEGEA